MTALWGRAEHASHCASTETHCPRTVVRGPQDLLQVLSRLEVIWVFREVVQGGQKNLVEFALVEVELAPDVIKIFVQQ